MKLLTKSALAVAITAYSLQLVACGGGGGGGDSSSSSSNNTTTNPAQKKITATVISSNTLTWEQGAALKLQLLDQDGKAIKAKSCHSDDTVRLSINQNCSALTTHRLGQSSFTVTGANNATTKVTVNTVPSKSPLAVNSGGQNDANRVVTSDGQVLTWGTNSYSQGLSQLSATKSEDIKYLQYPAPVVTANGDKLTNIYQVTNGVSTAYALTAEGKVYGWGHVGKATSSNNQSIPFAELVQDASGRKPLTNIVSLSTTSSFGYALGLTDNKKVMQWATGDKYYPAYVIDNDGNPLADIKAVGLNYQTGYAVNDQGQVYQWSLDANADTHPVSLVTDQSGKPITGVQKIVSNSTHSLALTKDGHVYAWGEAKDFLGNETYKGGSEQKVEFAVPVELKGQPLANIKDIAISFGSSYALTQSGNVYAWGTGSIGQLGDGTNEPLSNGTHVPHLVVSETGQGVLNNVVAITGGDDIALALKVDGTLVGWGRNWHGRLTQDNPEGVDEYHYPVVIQQSADKALNIGKPAEFTQLN